MKKLPDEIRLKRGIQVLLNNEDQEGLRKMAEERGTSLSSVVRSFVQEALEERQEQKKKAGKRKK